MALTEQKTLASVNHNIVANVLEVKWLNEILRDGETISSIPHRCSYGVDQKAQFEADLGADAAAYIAMAGW
jgi:hypothetical protein